MEKKTLNWTAKTLTTNMNKGNINYDCAVQRGLVWDTPRKSLLIHTMLYGYPIPAFYLVKNADGGYDALDGKQRSHAIKDYMEGGYPLSADLPPVYDDEGADMTAACAGKSYDELPEWAKDRIKDYPLSVVYYDDIDEAEIREMFRRLNNGKPLNAVELTRAKAKSIKDFQRIAKHPAIQATTTDKGKVRFADENTAMQIYAMLYMPVDDLDFSTKVFRPFIERAEVTEGQIAAIMLGLDYMDALVKVLAEEPKENKENARVFRKVKSRTHFVALTYAAAIAKAKGMSEADFIERAYDFFNCATTSTSVDYNSAISQGAAQAWAVRCRKGAMDKLVEG